MRLIAGSPFAGSDRSGLTRVGIGVAGALAAVVLGLAISMNSAAGWGIVGVLMGVSLFYLLAEYAFPIVVGFIAISPLVFPFLRVPPYVTFDRVVVIGLAAGVVLAPRVAGRSREGDRVTWMLLWLVGAFGLHAAVQSLSAMQIWLDSMLIPAILFLLISKFAVSERACVKIGAAMTVAGAGLGALGVAGKLLGFELASRAGGELRITAETGGEKVTRISGPYPVPEMYAVALIVCFAATLYWMLVRRDALAYAVGGTAATLEVAGLAFTLFRASWIAVLIVIFATFGLRPKRFGRTLGVALAIAALGFAGTSQLSSNQTFETRLHNTDNIQGRLATWVETVHVFGSSPLFGVGIDRYPIASPSFETVVVGGVAAVNFPHSSYFGMLAEQGLFGFIPFMALTVAVWYMLRAFRRRARSRHDIVLAAAAAGATLGYLLMSLTLMTVTLGASNMFFVIMLALCAGRLRALSVEEPPPPPPAREPAAPVPAAA